MLNIRGLDPSARSSQCWKVPYLENLVHQSIESYFFISITETWLIPAITKAQMEIHGYELFRSDRCDRERGGSCLYIKEELIVSDHLTYDNDYCEVIACYVDTVKTLIVSVYRPGKTPHQKFKGAMDFIQQCIDVKDDSWTLIITGDFNFPSICWKTLRFLSGGSDCGQCANVLLHFMELNMLSQVVGKPTRKAESGVENILDIVLTNSEESFREVETLDTSLSDHKYVSIILSDYFQGPKQNKNKLTKSFSHTAEVSFSSLNFHKADFEKNQFGSGKIGVGSTEV